MEEIIQTTTKYMDEIQEKVIELNTGYAGVMSGIIDKINGKIESIIIESDKQVNVSLSLATHGDIKLFDTCNSPIIGANYFVPVTFGISNDYKRFNLSAFKYIINDSIRVEAYGNQNTNVKVTIYYC